MTLRLDVVGITEGKPVPDRNALCGLEGMGPNVSPAVSWSDAPSETASFVLLCVDVSAPTVADDVNVEGRTVSADMPRADFGHWVVVDIDPAVAGIEEGAASDGVVAKGKEPDTSPVGRAGVNSYTSWFAGDADMEGQYFGYDGPCPPANDELIHRYQFRVYALDVARVDVSGPFTFDDVERAIDGHVLEMAQVEATFTLNAALR